MLVFILRAVLDCNFSQWLSYTFYMKLLFMKLHRRCTELKHELFHLIVLVLFAYTLIIDTTWNGSRLIMQNQFTWLSSQLMIYESLYTFYTYMWICSHQFPAYDYRQEIDFMIQASRFDERRQLKFLYDILIRLAANLYSSPSSTNFVVGFDFMIIELNFFLKYLFLNDDMV